MSKVSPCARWYATGRKGLRGKTASSTRWLQRQERDHYVVQARQQGLPSRAAFKLVEIDEKFSIIPKGGNIIELGASPGGWTRIAVERMGEGRLVAIDLQPPDIQEVGVEYLTEDVASEDLPGKLNDMFGLESVDLVMSDMAPNLTGNALLDDAGCEELCDAAIEIAEVCLRPEGSLIAKYFSGPCENNIRERLRESFHVVKSWKPPASRKRSKEMYFIARRFSRD